MRISSERLEKKKDTEKKRRKANRKIKTSRENVGEQTEKGKHQ